MNVGDTLTIEVALNDDALALTGKASFLSTRVCRLIDPNGTRTNVTPSAWSEDGSTAGLYFATITNAVEGSYEAVIDYIEAGHSSQVFAWAVSVETFSISASDLLSAAVPGSYAPGTAGAALGLIGSGLATTPSPVNPLSHLITVYQGDSYQAAESRQLDWTTTDAATWPDLTGATVVFVASHQRYRHDTIEVAATIMVATGAAKQVRVQLSASDTNDVRSGDYDYQLIATLSNADIITLVTGILTMTERVEVP